MVFRMGAVAKWRSTKSLKRRQRKFSFRNIKTPQICHKHAALPSAGSSNVHARRSRSEVEFVFNIKFNESGELVCIENSILFSIYLDGSKKGIKSTAVRPSCTDTHRSAWLCGPYLAQFCCSVFYPFFASNRNHRHRH